MEKADRPVVDGDREYHLRTRPNDLSAYCLLVGDPERAEMIAGRLFFGAIKVGDHRGLKSFTGYVNDLRMSVVTTSMGSAPTGIVTPEAARCGGRRFIRVGSCSTLWAEANIGDAAICTGAVRLDGASDNWAPHLGYPAVADYRVVTAMVDAAKELGLPHHVGIGATTTCFNEGQARPDINGYIPPRLQQLHDELVARRVLFYSMEEATLFTWCTTHSTRDREFWAGAVDAIYGNRITNLLRICGEEEAARIAIKAFILLEERFPILVK